MTRPPRRVAAVISLLGLPLWAARPPVMAGAQTMAQVSRDAHGVSIRLSFPPLGSAEALPAWWALQRAAPLPAGMRWGDAQPAEGSGAPGLSILVGLPADGRPTLTMRASPAVPVGGRLALASPVTSPAGTLALAPDRDPAAPVPARLESVAWMGARRLARIRVAPLRWEAGGAGVHQVRRLDLRLDFGTFAPPAAGPAAGVVAPDPSASVVAASLVNAEQALAWPAPPRTPAAQQASATAHGPRVLLQVASDGWYEVSGAELAAAGLALAELDPRRLALRLGDRPVAIEVVGEADGRLDPRDSIGFWGQRQRAVPGQIRLGNRTFPQVLGQERYGEAQAYLLGEEPPSQPPLRIGDRTAAPRDPRLPLVLTDRAVLREAPFTHYWSWHFTSDDTWFWDQLGLVGDADAARQYRIPVGQPDPAGRPAELRVAVVSRQGSHEVNLPVRAQVLVGQPARLLDERRWQGIKAQELGGEVQARELAGGLLDLSLVLNHDGGSLGTLLYLNTVELRYDRLLRAVDGALAFTAPNAASRVAVDGLGPGEAGEAPLALDITDPRVPVRLTGLRLTGGTGGRRAELATGGGAQLWVGGREAFRKPASIRLLPPTDLRAPTAGADHLIISPAPFLAGAERLAAHRRSNGLRSVVVDLQEVYDEFGAGLATPEAIRSFLRHAYHTWPAPAPRFVLLVGDGHWNLRGANPDYGDSPVFMPPYLGFWDPYQGEVDSTNRLGAIAGDDSLGDLAIGRAPVNSAAEMDAFVDKTLAYETAGKQAYQQQHVFITDFSPDLAGDFQMESERFIRDLLPPGALARRLRANDFVDSGVCRPGVACAAITDAIVDLFNREGGLFVNYIGHGSINRWSRAPVFTNAEVARLHNGDRLPIILSWTCLDGYWFHPTLVSLAELMLRAEASGSVAGFSATGLGVGPGHERLWQGFYRAVYDLGARELGTAAQSARLQLFMDGGFPDLVDTYTIFGDPALRLPVPAVRPSPSPTATSSATAPATATPTPGPATHPVFLPRVGVAGGP